MKLEKIPRIQASTTMVAVLLLLLSLSSSSAAAAECQDDADWLWSNRKGSRTRNCQDVAQKPKSFCKLVGTDQRDAWDACPVTCDTCPEDSTTGTTQEEEETETETETETTTEEETTGTNDDCSDDPSWATGSSRRPKTCDWVAGKPSSRCPRTGTDGRPASEACKATCESCNAASPPQEEEEEEEEEESAPAVEETLEECENSSIWTVTTKNGRKVNDCDWVAKKPSRYCSTVGDDGRLASQACRGVCESSCQPTDPPLFTSSGSGFNIEFVLGSRVSSTAPYAAAKQFWENVIVGDLPDVTDLAGLAHAASSSCGRYPNVIDDLHICALEFGYDGPGGVLGFATPDWIRSDSGLPIAGTMVFDSYDVSMFSSSSWAAVVKHEIGHVLGLGSIWSMSGLGVNVVSSNVYTGENARSVWRDDWGCNGSPPIERDGGAGTAGGHWDEECFETELMSGYLNNGSNPMSKLTVAALEDMGYSVDYTQASDYVPPSACCRNGGGSRALFRKQFRGGSINNKKKKKHLSQQAHSKAVEAGLAHLMKVKSQSTAPLVREQGDLTYVGDLFTSVLVEEDGEIYEVEVFADV